MWYVAQCVHYLSRVNRHGDQFFNDVSCGRFQRVNYARDTFAPHNQTLGISFLLFSPWRPPFVLPVLLPGAP